MDGTSGTYITATELSKKLGYSRQHIARTIRNLQLDVQKSSKGYALTQEQAEQVTSFLRGGEAAQTDSEAQADRNMVNKALLEQLTQQLEVLNNQLEAKDKQIQGYQEQVVALTEQVSTLLETNKALSATNAMQVAAEKKDKLLAEPQDAPAQQEEKVSFWRRLFK